MAIGGSKTKTSNKVWFEKWYVGQENIPEGVRATPSNEFKNVYIVKVPNMGKKIKPQQNKSA